MPQTEASALKFLPPGSFAIPMSLAGLALAWARAQPLMGDAGRVVAQACALLALLAFVVLALASLWRARRHPEAWAEDRRHPVRHTTVAALPVSLILLATAAVLLAGPSLAARLVWWAGALLQVLVTWWVLGRWWRPPGAQPGPAWAGVTPLLFIPIVGHVLVPLAGVALGHGQWAAAQFGIGLLFWPVVLGLLCARIVGQGLWPERLLPSSAILVAPPAVIGQSLLQLGAPVLWGWALWGVAMFTLLWVALLLRRLTALPFGLGHWAMGFPLAALAGLTLRLAEPGTPMALLGIALLAATSLLVAALLLATLRGLRDGSLLVAEPVASIVPAPAPAPP